MTILQPTLIDIEGLEEIPIIELAPPFMTAETKEKEAKARHEEKVVEFAEYFSQRDEGAARARAEREQAELSGRMTADAETYYEMAIKGKIKSSVDLQPSKRIPVVQGLLEHNTVNWIAAGSGTYKSFVSADLAFRYGSEDMDYHGRKMTHGRALIVLAEGAAGYAYRQMAWEREHDRQVKGVDYLPHAVQLGKPHEVAALCHALKQADEEGNPYGMILIDTQAMSTVGVDENGSEMNAVIAQLGRIRDVTGACVLVVHHFGKDKRSGMRGSSMLYAAADTIIVTAKRKDADGEPVLGVTLSTDPTDGGKQKELQAEGDVLSLDLRVHTVGEDYFGDPISSLVPVGADTRSADVQPTQGDEFDASLPTPTETQMSYLKAINFYETKGVSPAGLAAKMNEDAGHKVTYGQLCRNTLIALSKMGKGGLVEQPQPKGHWFITPMGVSVIAKDMIDKARVGEGWTERAGRSRRGNGPSEDAQELPSGEVSEEVSEGSAKPPGETS